MRLGLILSNDWELFGDGSGDYFEVQHRPLEELLFTVEKYDAKLTVMAEVGQQWAHKKVAKNELWAQEITKAWESILKETIERRSDVQLHLHPQWLNATFENGQFNVDLSQWAVSHLKPEKMEEALTAGKNYLEELLCAVKPSYKCLAFRAGSWCIEPSKDVMNKLLHSGFICDTSVTKGYFENHFYDYRDAYSNVLPWFASSNSIKYKNGTQDGLLEIPICSHEGFDSQVLRKLISPQLFYWLRFGVYISNDDKSWHEERRRIQKKRYGVSKRPFWGNKLRSLRWVFSRFLVKSSIQLDYDFLPPKPFVKCMQKACEQNFLRDLEDKDVIIPIMASGHVKNMHNCNNIDRILNEVKQTFKEDIIFWTLSEAVSYWNQTLKEAFKTMPKGWNH